MEASKRFEVLSKLDEGPRRIACTVALSLEKDGLVELNADEKRAAALMSRRGDFYRPVARGGGFMTKLTFEGRDELRRLKAGAVKAPFVSDELVLAWCDKYDGQSTEGWLADVLNGDLSIENLRSAILEGRPVR